MKAPTGSYEESRLFSLQQFQRLSAAQKLRWLAEMAEFLDRVSPQIRRRRFAAGSRKSR